MEAPCLSQRGFVEVHPTQPTKHVSLLVTWAWRSGVWLPQNPPFQINNEGGMPCSKGSFGNFREKEKTSLTQTRLSCGTVASHCTSLCLGMPIWKTGCIYLPPGRVVSHVTGDVLNMHR